MNVDQVLDHDERHTYKERLYYQSIRRWDLNDDYRKGNDHERWFNALIAPDSDTWLALPNLCELEEANRREIRQLRNGGGKSIPDNGPSRVELANTASSMTP